MLGRTHVATTTATGSAGIYLLHLAQRSTDERISGVASTVIDAMGMTFMPFDLAHPWQFLLWMSICIVSLGFGALLPDVDSKSSILGRYVPWIQDAIGHRTLTHTVWVLIPLFFAAYWFGHVVLWMIAIGYWLHIVQDSFSVQGINWFWPLGKGFHIKLYRVGGIVEDIIYGLSMGVHVWLLYTWATFYGYSFPV